MKVHWDREYMKRGFQAVLLFAVIYAVKLLLDAASFFLSGDTLSGAGGFFAELFSLLSPLVFAFVIAYLADPLVDFFQRLYDGRVKGFLLNMRIIKTRKRKQEKEEYLYKRRTEGTVAVYLLVIASVAVLLVYATKNISRDDGMLWDAASYYITKTMNNFSDAFVNVQLSLNEAGLLEYLSDYISKLLAYINDFLQRITGSIVAGAASAGKSIPDFLIGLVAAFYFLREKEMIKYKTKEISGLFLSEKIYKLAQGFLTDVHMVFMAFIRGQLIDSLIMAVLISGALLLIGVKFALLIGIFAGVANLIPYFGAVIGAALAVITALVTGEPIKALYAGIAILALQQIDGMYIAPKIMGRNMDLSPVLVLISISVGGRLMGIWGMLLAVPVCAVIRLLLLRMINSKKLNRSA